MYVHTHTNEHAYRETRRMSRAGGRERERTGERRRMVCVRAQPWTPHLEDPEFHRVGEISGASVRPTPPPRRVADFPCARIRLPRRCVNPTYSAVPHPAGRTAGCLPSSGDSPDRLPRSYAAKGGNPNETGRHSALPRRPLPRSVRLFET